MKFSHLNLHLTLITLIASLGGVLFGFDMAVVSGVLPLLHKHFHFGPFMEGWVVSSALIGCIIGVFASGILTDIIGRRKMLSLSAFFFLLSALGCSFSADLPMLIAFRVLGGLGVGIASNIVPLYISEIAPVDSRGRLVSIYQLAITTGILIAYFMNSTLVDLASQNRQFFSTQWLDYLFFKETWRGMFLIGAAPALLYFAGTFIIPESRRWLESKRYESLASHSKEGKESFYTLLFSKKMRKPLILGILLPLFSQLSGINAIIYYGPMILGKSGFDLSNALQAQMFFGIANVVFTMIAIWKVDTLGRRPLYLIGSAGAAVSLFIISLHFFLDFQPGFFLAILVMVFLMCFAFSIGPLKFVIVSEIFPDAIRGRAMALSIMTMWISDTIIGLITPLFISLSTSLTFGIFSLCCLGAFIIIYNIYPETKGKTFEQIQSIWQRNK